MPQYEISVPGKGTFRVNSPTPLTDQQAWQAVQAQLNVPEPQTAGFSLADTGRVAQQGLYGGLQTLTDLFGAGNVASKELTALQQEAMGKLSEERKAEIARRELLKKKAEGNTLEEIKATVGGFTEAPFQTSVAALTGSLPVIASAFIPGGQPAAVAGLTGRAALGARALAAAKSPAAGIGALMGVGGQKGQDYAAVKEALLAKNFSEADAERLAQEVSGYSLENAPRQLASGLVGGLEGVTGIEGLLGRAGRLGKALPKVDKAVDLPEPTFGGALRRNIVGEALPEAAQAATGQVGTNIALNQAGIPTDLMQGVAAQVVNDALVGGTLGAGFSPLKLREMRQEFVNDEIARKREEDAKIAEGIKKAAAQREQTKQQIVGKQPLLLPAPSQELEPVKEVAPLQNPIGNLTPDELGPEVSSYLNQYRKANGLPRLQSYSIEDVKDAMTAINPEGEKAALDSILAAKTGYTGQQNFTAKDVENAAIEKNVATGTKGFSDFLARTTGVNNLQEMSEPQLYAAFKALSDMPANTTGQQTVLPEGTNASRFTQKQYDSAVKYVGLTFQENNGKPLSTETILADIKDSTNLATDRDAKALLDTAIKNGDLEKSEQVVYRTFKPENDQMVATYPTRERAEAAAKKQGLNVREATLTQVAPKAPVTPPTAPRAGLPAGYDITERQFKEGEEPEGYQITSEEGGKPFPTVLNQAEVQGKIDQLSTDRREIADNKLQEVLKYEQTVNEGKRELEKLEAAGEFDTDNYKQKKARQAAKEDLLGKRIEALYKEITSLTAPLKSKPVGSKPIARKGFTVTKDGKESGTFPTREAAEESILAGLSDAELDALVSDKKFGGLQTRIINEQNRRSGKVAVDEQGKPVKTKKVSEVLKDMESGPEVPETPELLAKTKPLRDMLNRFGLGDVALKIVKAIENRADGSYAAKVIELALDAKFPIRTLRHESLHALKELGFFTDAQWKSLEKMAKSKWIDQYLKKGSKALLSDGSVGSRYDAYIDINQTAPAQWNKDNPDQPPRKVMSDTEMQELLIEEAIADAFGDFDVNKAPPGFLTALLNKMRGFFESLNNYLAGRGFENSQDIFGAVEKGQLKSGQAQAGGKKLSVQAAEEGEPVKKVDPNDVSNIVNNSPYKDAGINVLTSQLEKTSKPLEVDDVGRLFDGAYMAEFGKQGDWRNPADFKRAVVQAVDELKIQLQQSKSGLDWYDEDIAKAFELTQQSIPSLKKPEKRALFSVIAGIMSPSTNARDNWVIAAQAYQHYEKTGVLPGTNPATGGLWMGGLESANKKKQLDMLNAMLQPKSKGGLGEKGAVEWLQGSHTVAEITNFRSKYGGMGKSNVGGKATDVLPGFTAFGPKVGPFVMNINGIHEVTVDVWMTRTFNRYFGQMMGPDGKMVRAPTEPQRIAIKNLAVLAAQQLGIKPYQVQSVLWFMEQQIFNKLGTGAKSYGFSDGAVKFSETQGGVGGAKVPPANSGSNAVANQPTGQQAGRAGVQAGQPTTRTTQQGVDNATGRKLPVGQPAVRSGAGGRKKLSVQAAEEGQPESAGDRRGRGQGRGLTPLAGAPIISGATGPDPRIVQVAEDYAKQYEIPYRRQAVYAEIDEDFSKLVADAYEAMPHAPRDPKVKEAYQDLMRQTRNQYDALVDAGYSFTFFDSNTDPYAGNPFNAMRDLRQNQQMAVYGTYDGYGTEGITGAAVEDNPMLEDTGLRWPDQDGVEHMVTANDLFRAVHDAFGHGLEGAGFRAQGEENAWQAHARLFTGPAVGAITSETRGQNSWLNYGPYGEKNRTAKLEDTVFAEQKTGLMPPWTWQDRLVDDEGLVLGIQQPDAISIKGLHYGKARVAELDASKFGTGLRGAERRRLEQTDDERIKKRVYFYVQKPDGSTPYPESGVGPYVYTQQFDNVLSSGPTMSRLFNEANGDSNNFESLVVDAGYDGYAVPSMGMMVILNHNTPVKYKGTRSELTDKQKKLSLSEAPPNSLLTKRMSNIGIKSTDDFWKRIQNVMIGTGSRNPSLGAALDTTSTSDQVKQAISVWKQDVAASGIQNYLQRFRIQGAVPEIDDVIAGPPSVKKMLLEAGIRPTLGNAIAAYNSLPQSAVNDIRYSLREAPDTPEFKQFFKRSGFINSSGQPMTMYHATDADITEFKTSEDGKLGAGIYLSSDSDYVNQFAPEGNVMPLYVSAQNPFPINIGTGNVASGINQQMEAAVTLLTQGKKRLKDLTGQQVQNLFKRNGYDGILARDDAGNIIEATVFKPEQVKSATGNIGTYSPKSKDVRYSVRDATDMFEPSAVEEYSTQYSKSKIKMVNMPIEDFLKIAEFGYNKDKEIAANERVQTGVKFKTLPGLTVYTKDGDLQVTGHEGRHRARALQKAGYETMPVLWESDIIWGAQTDPEAWGYEAKWPDRVYAQKGALREYSSIPMPFTREESVQNYQAPAKKFSVRSVEDTIKALPNGDKIHQAVATKTTVREEKSIARRILDAFAGDSIATLRQQALNRYNQLSVYDKRLADQMGGKALLADSSAEAAALLSDTASGVAAAAFGVNNIGGAPVYRNGVTVVDNFDGKVKGLMDILMPLAEMKDPFAYRAFQFYAASKRGSRFEADGKEKPFDKDDFAYAAQLEAEYPVFKQVHADWIAYNDKLVDYMVATGVISKDKAKEFTKYADYIPFYRQLEGQDTIGPKVFQSISGVKAPKKLKGDSDAPIADFMETMVRNTQSIIQAGMKNTAAQKAIDVATQLGMTEKLDKQSSAPGTVTIMRDGEYVSYAVGDQLFIDSVTSLNMPDVKLWGIFSGPANLLRNMVTKDPGFMLANLLRDSMSAYVTSGVKMTPVADTVANFGRALGGTDPTYQALVKAGILGGYDYAQGVERSGAMLAADLRKRTGSQSLSEKALDGFGLWSTLEKGTSASDAATRMAVYNSVLKDTGNEAEAIFRALEVMNFNRKGANPMVRLLTAAIPFLNARMQGLDVFYRAGIQPFFDKNPTDRAKAVQKAFFVRGMYLTSLSIAYWAMTHDDDDYLAQEQETRDNNWLIPSLGVKIPIPFEVGVLFKVIPERIMGYTFGDDTGKDFAESMGRAAWSTFGFLPVPQTALPMLEAYTNYSFYTGRNIVGAGMEGVAAEAQKGPNTSKIATFLGEGLGISPIKVDHMIKGYTGTIGTYMVDLMDSIGDLNSESPKAAKRFEQLPVWKRFSLDPEAKGTVTAYYKLKDAVDETVRTINLLERTGRYDELSVYAQENAKMFASRQYISSMEKQMKTLREAALQINNSSMSATEKRDALSTINQAQINMTRHIQGIKKIVSE